MVPFHEELWLPWQPKEKSLKIFSKTTKPRALIFGIQHQLMTLCQVCSKLTPGPKMAPPRGLSVLHRLIQENLEKSSSLKYKVQSFDVWYVLSPNGPLPILFKLRPPGQKWPYPGAYKFFIEKSLKSSFPKPQSVDLSYLVWIISQQACTKFVQIMFR